MKIYTRNGDQGTTRLKDGKEVSKSNIRIEACGCIDELTAALGCVVSGKLPDELRDSLLIIQDNLLRLGSDLSDSNWPIKTPLLNPSCIEKIEEWIDRVEQELPHLQFFIFPGGIREAADLHFARTICRRAERRVQALAEKESLTPFAIPFLNRLGDLLFVMARWVNLKAGRKEMTWKL